MAVTLTTSPTYALPGLVDVTASADTGDFVKLWLTDAPLGSKWRQKLDADGGSRVLVESLDAGRSFPFDADKGGAYVFASQEYTRGPSAGNGGGYEGDPKSFTELTESGSEESLTVYVGDRLTMRLASGSTTATLELHVWNDTVRATDVATHHVATPRITGASSPAAAAAAADSSVVAALAGMVDITASTMSSGLVALWQEMIVDIPAHFNRSACHTAADAVNDTAVEELPDEPSSPEGWARSVATLARSLRQHMTNDGESVFGSSRYHAPADFKNLALVPIPSQSGADMGGVFTALAGIYQAYELHRVDTDAHTEADATNALGNGLGKLLTVHAAFASALLPLQPTAAANQNPGTVRLTALGFRS